MYNSIKKNKTIIRRKNEAGNFTTVSYKLLRDKNLKPNSKLLLIEILSDCDSFTLSQSLYCNRLGIDKRTFTSSIKDLENNGYCRRSKIKNTNLYHYTFSEFGNLNKTVEEVSTPTETTPISATPIEVKPEIKTSTPKPTFKVTEASIKAVQNVISKNKVLIDSLIETDLNNIENIFNDYGMSYEGKERLEKFFQQKQKDCYQKLMKEVTNSTAINKKNHSLAKKIMIEQIFEKQNTKLNLSTLLKMTSKKVQKNKGWDFETQLVEDYENPLD